MTASDVQFVQHAVPGPVMDPLGIRYVIQYQQNLVEFLHAQALGLLSDALLLLHDAAQRVLVPFRPPGLLVVSVHAQLLADVVLDRVSG